MKDLSKADEQKALLALEKAIDMVGDGMSPDDAITKVAQDEKLTAPMTQRLIEAYNVSKTLHHLQNVEGEKRAESFSVADPSAILGAMFPKEPATEQQKAAAELHPDYFVKAASAHDYMAIDTLPELPRLTDKTPVAYERDPAALAKRAFDQRNRLTIEWRKSETLARRSYREMLGNVEKAASYWRQTSPTEPFELVEKRAVARFGEMGKSLMDLIYAQGGLGDRRLHVKRASADDLDGRQAMFDNTKFPYAYAHDAVLSAKQALSMSKEAAHRQRALHLHALNNLNILPEPIGMAAVEFFMDKPAAEKISKEEANYRPATGMTRCGTCTNFNAKSNTCDVVAGDISSDYVSDQYAAKAKAAHDIYRALKQTKLAAGMSAAEKAHAIAHWAERERGELVEEKG